MEESPPSRKDNNKEHEMLLRPPILRPSLVLDKAKFAKTINIAAASIRDPRNITKLRATFSKSLDLLKIDRISSVITYPDSSVAAKRTKCLLLHPGIRAEDSKTWSPAVHEAVEKNEVELMPYELRLDYDHWDYHQVLSSLLPEEMQDDIPGGFNTAGHVAHLNLRQQHLPYKHLIGQVILDKNANIDTVINKIDNVGTESQFRTFAYEVLAGRDDMNVEVKENECIFKFDYSKVYWNSKLEPEHTRLIKSFRAGEVVCDVMAGIGPFAVPAGKRGVFVWANDYNPESCRYLEDAIKRNKVSEFVKAFNKDGRDFIKQATDAVLAASRNGECAVVAPKKPASRSKPTPAVAATRVPLPPTISHYVMNLPASAIDFLPHFRGIYVDQEDLFTPKTATPLPLVHVHCFALKSDDAVPLEDVRQRVSVSLGHEMKLGDPEVDGEMLVYNVRAVAPAKSMFCATFRLPAAIAFAKAA